MENKGKWFKHYRLLFNKRYLRKWYKALHILWVRPFRCWVRPVLFKYQIWHWITLRNPPGLRFAGLLADEGGKSTQGCRGNLIVKDGGSAGQQKATQTISTSQHLGQVFHFQQSPPEGQSGHPSWCQDWLQPTQKQPLPPRCNDSQRAHFYVQRPLQIHSNFPTFVTTSPTLDKAKDSRLSTSHRSGMAEVLWDNRTPEKNSLWREGEGEEVPRQNHPRAEPAFVRNLFFLDLKKLERAGCHHSQTNFHLKMIFCSFPKSNFHHFQVRAKKLCDHCVNCGKKRIKKIVTNASQEVFTNLPYSLCPRSTRLKQRCCADFPAFPIVRERG